MLLANEEVMHYRRKASSRKTNDLYSWAQKHLPIGISSWRRSNALEDVVSTQEGLFAFSMD